MKKATSGFTIVELLIVIVVIAILAAISIVAYSGIQARARDNIRYNDLKAIQKALELYKIDKGQYPSWTDGSEWVTASSTCGAVHTNGYSYSTASDGSWMKPLIAGGYLKTAPLAPSNSCGSYYSYISPGDPRSWNCPTRTKNYYVLQAVGVDGPAPAEASDPSDGSNWQPCSGSDVGWGAGTTSWVFTENDA